MGGATVLEGQRPEIPEPSLQGWVSFVKTYSGLKARDSLTLFHFDF